MIHKFDKEKFEKMPVVGILRNIPLDVVKQVVPLYEKAGLTTIEVTMNSSDVESSIAFIKQEHPNLNIGTGTVCTIEDVKKSVEYGASFIVTPILDEEVVKFCVSHEIPVFPGAFTPTEIYKAYSLGATAVKVFPATQLGAPYIKDVLAPLNNVKIIPTGGVSLENIHTFFEVGVVGVGMGSSLFHKEYIATNNFDALYNHFNDVVKKVKSCLG
ncbi:bifunctional 4-hydroxy-2-oxoglutarate aldolase/2-dehydro-3-deoxy-phosphogluconate aldolase [Urechidicola sp. KH5]